MGVDRDPGRVRAEEDVPIALRRLWGLSRTSRLGRPSELGVERVVRTAVELADREGLSGVTLPKVAKVLGYTAMSLYRHVGSKEELLFLMQDFAIGSPPEIVVDSGEWREGLRQWASAERLLYHRRPWLPRLPITGPPAGPNQIAWMEIALRLLSDTGLDWAEKLGIMSLISGYVRQATLLSQDLQRGRSGARIDQAEAEQLYGRSLNKLIDPDKFPETARLFASGVFEIPERAPGNGPPIDTDFSFGLERILDGVAAAIARTLQAPEPGARATRRFRGRT